MEKIHISIQINANLKKVWHTMLDDEGYRQWTHVFQEGSFFEGSWDEGTEIRFLAPDKDGKMQGMFSRVKDSRKYSFVSIEHRGLILDGKIDTSSDEGKKWLSSYENYSFEDRNGLTELTIDMNLPSEYVSMMEEMWPVALKTLKAMCEQ